MLFVRKFKLTSKFDTEISEAIYVLVTELLINLLPSIVLDVIYEFAITPVNPVKLVTGVNHCKAAVAVLY